MFLCAGHLLLLAGFFLPWVGGSFGARSGLSGLDLAAIARDVAAVDAYSVSSEARAMMVALYALPALAVDGLLISAFGTRLGLPPRVVGPLAQLLAVPALLLATAVLLLSVFAAHSSVLFDGPAYGLYVELSVSGALVMGALAPRLAALARRVRRPRVDEMN